ncbi:hypothetical protein D3C78_1322010 [compost metagenome]
MKAIFDRYERDIIPKKGARTQKDNLAELRQLRPFFDEAPIGSWPPSPRFSTWLGNGVSLRRRTRARACGRIRRSPATFMPMTLCGMRSTGRRCRN